MKNNKTKETKLKVGKDFEAIVKKIEDKLFPETIRKSQVFHFHERDSRVFVPYDVNHDETEWINPNSKEAFVRDKPVLYNKDIPVYFTMRNETKALTFKLNFNEKNNKLSLDENLINATEMKVVQESSARQSILKSSKMSYAQMITTVLCCIITALITYIICSPFMV